MNPELHNKLKRAKTAILLQERLDRELYIGIEDVKEMAGEVDNIVQIDELIRAMGVSVMGNITDEAGIFTWKLSETKKISFDCETKKISFDCETKKISFTANSCTFSHQMSDSITSDLKNIKTLIIKLFD